MNVFLSTKFRPIILSLLDLDLYKLTVHQMAFHNYPDKEGEYEFTCRNKDKVDLLKYVPEEELREQIFVHLANLRLTDEDFKDLAVKGIFKETYLQYLRNFQFDPEKHITITRKEEDKTYRICAKGPIIAIKLYETLILSILNEIFENNYTGQNIEEVRTVGLKLLHDKVAKIQMYNQLCIQNGIEVPKIIEFGTRRRFSRNWQEEVIAVLKKQLPDNLIGTSNVYFAYRFGLKAIGTFGHEYMMAMQGLTRLQDSQKLGLQMWLEEYRGQMSIALTDTLGDEKFFKDFDYAFAKAYDGVRHDSGCPFKYGERIIQMYKDFGIDPMTKTIVFSDGLDVDTMIGLHVKFVGKIKIIFGIGTNLTNDLGNPVLQNVMKLAYFNKQDVCKLSANPAKACCRNPLFLEYMKMAIELY